MTKDAVPVPDDVEYHPAAYPWERREFSEVRVLALGEGSAVYAAKGRGAFWIIKDEGTLADFLDPDDPTQQQLISLERYNSEATWHDAVELMVERVRQHFDRTGWPDDPIYEERRQGWQERFDERHRHKGGAMTIEKGFYQLHIDGGRKHPRDGEPATAAYAYILCDPKGNELSNGRAGSAITPAVRDSTSAEYEGALAGLADAKDRGIPYIAVFTDSRNLVNQITDRFEARQHLAEYKVKLQEALEAFSDWQVSWVPREWNKAHGDVAGSL